MARDFKTIGVVGLGTMGAGITEVFARTGYTVVGVEVDDDAVARGRQHLEHSTARAVSRGKLSEEDAQALHDRVTFATSMEELKDADLVVEAVVESIDDQEADLQAARGHRRRGRHPRDQHLLAVGHGDLDRQLPPRPGHRRALLQPRPRAGVRRDRAHRRHRARRPRGRLRAGAGAGQEPRRLWRQGRLHREHAAVRLPQPRGLHVRGPLRLPRGHRRGDAVRLRLPDGPAGPARPDRSRHGVRDPRDDVPPGSRPPARACAGPQADGHRRHARPEDRQGLLHLRGGRQPRRRGRRQDPLGRRQAAAQARHQARRRRRHRHDGHRHHRGLRQGWVRRRLRRPLAGQGRWRAYDDRALARQGDPARQARRGRQAGRARSADRLDLARRPRPGRHRGRGDRRGPEDQDDVCSRTSTRSASPAPSSRPRRPRCRSSSARRRPTARRTSSGCTSSTRRRS